jgi:hypothetical protein
MSIHNNACLKPAINGAEEGNGVEDSTRKRRREDEELTCAIDRRPFTIRVWQVTGIFGIGIDWRNRPIPPILSRCHELSHRYVLSHDRNYLSHIWILYNVEAECSLLTCKYWRPVTNFGTNRACW